MNRAYLNARGIFAMLTLDRHIDKVFFRNRIGIVVVLSVLEIYKVSLLEPEYPYPLGLSLEARVVVLSHTGIYASSAPYTS